MCDTCLKIGLPIDYRYYLYLLTIFSGIYGYMYLEDLAAFNGYIDLAIDTHYYLDEHAVAGEKYYEFMQVSADVARINSPVKVINPPMSYSEHFTMFFDSPREWFYSNFSMELENIRRFYNVIETAATMRWVISEFEKLAYFRHQVFVRHYYWLFNLLEQYADSKDKLGAINMFFGTILYKLWGGFLYIAIEGFWLAWFLFIKPLARSGRFFIESILDTFVYLLGYKVFKCFVILVYLDYVLTSTLWYLWHINTKLGGFPWTSAG